MLTEEEKFLIQKAFTEGPSAFSMTNWGYAEVKAFMEREDVREEFGNLKKGFEHQDALGALARFTSRRRLIRMKDDALDVLQRSMEGPNYVELGGYVCTDLNGRPIIRTPEPTLGQRHAAQDVLDRINVISDKQLVSPSNVNVNVMFKHEEERTVEIAKDPKHVSEEQRSLSREKVRNAIEVLMGEVRELQPKLPKPRKKKIVKKPVKKLPTLLRKKSNAKKTAKA